MSTISLKVVGNFGTFGKDLLVIMHVAIDEIKITFAWPGTLQAALMRLLSLAMTTARFLV